MASASSTLCADMATGELGSGNGAPNFMSWLPCISLFTNCRGVLVFDKCIVRGIGWLRDNMRVMWCT